MPYFIFSFIVPKIKFKHSKLIVTLKIILILQIKKSLLEIRSDKIVIIISFNET